MNAKKRLENRIRGWLPKEPTLPGKYTPNSPDDQKTKQPRNKQSRFLRGIIYGLFFVLIGIMNLFSRQYAIASLYFVGAIAIIVIAYLAQKRQIQIRPRTAFGVLLIGIGVAIFFYNDIAVVLFGSLAIFAPFFLTIITLFTFWIVIALVVGVAVLVRANRKNGIVVNFLKRNLRKRRLLPYGAAAIFIFLSYIAVISGIQFVYAVPITFIISGVLVLKGLRRFAVTIPALAVLLISMLLLGSAVAGTYTVTYVSENRFLASSQAPNVDTINLAVKSVAGDIKLYFTNDDTQICHVGFVKEYGPIFSRRSSEYHYQSNYDSEPASGFNYTIENGEVNVTLSSYTTLVNITVNQNLKLNLNLYTYFGDITVETPPTASSIQTMNLTSQLGDITLKITNTTNLQSLSAITSYRVEAYISSTSQNQDAIVLLKGGSVKLNLDVTNIDSEIFAYSTGKYGELEAKTQGFIVLDQNNTYFNAQTHNYNNSALKKIDVNATSGESTRPSMDIIANYNEK